jgi:hypothetical protein
MNRPRTPIEPAIHNSSAHGRPARRRCFSRCSEVFCRAELLQNAVKVLRSQGLMRTPNGDRASRRPGGNAPVRGRPFPGTVRGRRAATPRRTGQRAISTKTVLKAFSRGEETRQLSVSDDGVRGVPVAESGVGSRRMMRGYSDRTTTVGCFYAPKVQHVRNIRHEERWNRRMASGSPVLIRRCENCGMRGGAIVPAKRFMSLVLDPFENPTQPVP